LKPTKPLWINSTRYDPTPSTQTIYSPGHRQRAVVPAGVADKLCMMTKHQALAEQINGIEYGTDPVCKEPGLVVLYGASDDLLELNGAIYDELGAYNGGEYYLCKKKKGWQALNEEDFEDDQEKASEYDVAIPHIKIKMSWDVDTPDGRFSWLLTTDYPHHSHFDIMEDGEVFCRGLVIDLNQFTPVWEGRKV